MSEKWIVAVGETRAATDSKPSASAPYRAASSKDGFPPLVRETLYELFTKSVECFPNHECLGSRPRGADGKAGPFVFETYKQVGEQVVALASGAASLGVKPGQKVGIYGPNCAEWMKAMQACNRMSYTCVPLYDSLGENAVEYILNHSEAAAAFVSADKLPKLLKALPKTKAHLKHIVIWGAVANAASIDAAKAEGHTVTTFDELLKMGNDNPTDPVPPKATDIATIMYTSGTTGDPKGVMLTHMAILTGVTNSNEFARLSNISFGEGDRFLSYLPLAHIFDRVLEEWFLYLGGAIGYFQGDVTKLLDDVATLNPAYFVAVPRVFDRIYSKVIGGVKAGSFIKRLLFNWGFSHKLKNLKKGYAQNKAAPFFDKLVFSKVSAAFGGKLKACGSGGAPLSPHVEHFLRVTMCCPVVQGYGLTETTGSSFCAVPDEWSHCSSVGPPCPCTEVRFESVPEMNYDALAPLPKGEVLIRGTGNFSGYYKDEERTKEEVEEDGWFHTGDIGMLTESGAIQLIDRKKNIFKLSQGEYVAVEKVEASYRKNLIAEMLWVYGSSFKSSLVAVVVPAASLLTWAKENGIDGDMEAVCKNDRAKEYVLAELVATGKAEKLKGYEIIKSVHLVPEPFSIEEGLITPTFKLKRPQLQKKFQAEIDALYKAQEP